VLQHLPLGRYCKSLKRYNSRLRILLISNGEYSDTSDITKEEIEKSEEALATMSDDGQEDNNFRGRKLHVGFTDVV